MKKLLFLVALLLPTVAFGINDLYRGDWGKLGTITSCTVDTDVDVALATTVDADSAAAAKTLNLTATTNLAAGDTLLIDKEGDGDGKEVCVVDTVNAGVSVDCVDNLTYTHLGATGDDVTLTNRIGPLSGGQTYIIQAVSAADALVVGHFISGDQYVDAATNYGVTWTNVAGQPGVTFRALSTAPYVSVSVQASNSIVKVCQIR